MKLGWNTFCRDTKGEVICWQIPPFMEGAVREQAGLRTLRGAAGTLYFEVIFEESALLSVHGVF